MSKLFNPAFKAEDFKKDAMDLLGKTISNLQRKYNKKTNEQEWGYLCSDMMDLLSQPNLAGFSLIGNFMKEGGNDKEAKLIPGPDCKILDDFNTGEKWNEKIKNQLIEFANEYNSEGNSIILCCEEYASRSKKGEFACIQGKSSDLSEYVRDTTKLDSGVMPYSVETMEIGGELLGFMNIHNSSGKNDTDAAEVLITKINENEENKPEGIEHFIYGGDSNCYYSPFGKKMSIEGIKKIATTFQDSHNTYISKHCIAKFRPNNFLLNAQTMTKGGTTDFEETMFLMVPKDEKFKVNINEELYVLLDADSNIENTLNNDSNNWIAGFNGALEIPESLDELKLSPGSSSKSGKDKFDVQYFRENLLSDHLPIMANVTYKTETVFVCFSNNLSIQGARGLKGRKENVWAKDFDSEELKLFNQKIMDSVLEVLQKYSVEGDGYKLTVDFDQLYKKAYTEMVEKIYLLLKFEKRKTDDPTIDQIRSLAKQTYTKDMLKPPIATLKSPKITVDGTTMTVGGGGSIKKNKKNSRKNSKKRFRKTYRSKKR